MTSVTPSDAMLLFLQLQEMPIVQTKNNFVILKDPVSGFTNYSIIFKAAEREIYRLFDSMEYFSYDIFESKSKPKSVDYHLKRGNIKIIDGDLYFNSKIDNFIDAMIPHIYIPLYIARENMFESISKLPLIFANKDEVQKSLQDMTPEKEEKITAWYKAIDDFNKKMLQIIKDNIDKYSKML